MRPLSYREPSLRATPVPTTGNIRRSPWKMSAWRLVRWEREISENLFWKSDLPTEVSPLTLLFDSYEIITLKEREQCLQDSGLPHSYSEVGTDSAECLQIVLQDVTNHLELQLFYTVFEECDVITRSARLINHSDASVTLNRCLSAQLDLTEDYSMITHFSGAWAREMHREQISLRSGKFVNASYTGTSSNRSNPFMILGHKNTCETFWLLYRLQSDLQWKSL